MEDMYIKPGNQERGWNDPPQFSYGLQKARGPQKNILSKRAGPPPAAGLALPSSCPLAPPPAGSAPPPLHPAAPPPGCVATPSFPPAPIRSQKKEDSSIQSELEPDIEDVLSVLNGALTVCRNTVKEQVCNDVCKRLRLLEDGWRTGRLSLPVRRRMDLLSQELQAGRWDSADDLHRSLMVDHVTEVSQWMVGVKRLIAETRKLSPELLEAFQKHAERNQNKDQNKNEEQEPAESDQDGAQPIEDQENPVQDQEKPVQDQETPVQDQEKPVQDQEKPVQDQEKPVQDQEKPVQDKVEPVKDPVSES